MLRFTCCPTRDLTLNDLRFALFHCIVAKQRKEDLIARVEDTDPQRNIEGKDQENLALLALFGIESSQVLHQSQNFRFHSAMALQLLHEKKAFNCFCPSADLQDQYNGNCENLPAELVIDNTNPFSVRIRKPDAAIVIEDLIQGKIDFQAHQFDSFVILKQDKTPTPLFATAIDDMLSDISVIISAAKDLYDAPKQEYIRQSLHYDKTVKYAHIPTILEDEGVSVKSLLEDGFLPSAISNYLISMGTEYSHKIFTLQEATEFFDLAKLPQTPARFDKEALRSLNKEHLKNLENKELSRYVGFADEEIGALAKFYLGQACTTKELRCKIEPVFAPKVLPQDLQDSAAIVRNVIHSAPHFEEYAVLKAFIMKESQLQEDLVEDLLLFLLTGTNESVDLACIYPYLRNYIKEIIK